MLVGFEVLFQLLLCRAFLVLGRELAGLQVCKLVGPGGAMGDLDQQKLGLELGGWLATADEGWQSLVRSTRRPKFHHLPLLGIHK